MKQLYTKMVSLFCGEQTFVTKNFNNANYYKEFYCVEERDTKFSFVDGFS